MAMKKKPGRSKVEVGIPSTEAVFSAGNNNASGSLIANLATQNRAELAYELREIALQDIELNPDNAISASWTPTRMWKHWPTTLTATD